jgi:hypothetical protein
MACTITVEGILVSGQFSKMNQRIKRVGDKRPEQAASSFGI